MAWVVAGGGSGAEEDGSRRPSQPSNALLNALVGFSPCARVSVSVCVCLCPSVCLCVCAVRYFSLSLPLSLSLSLSIFRGRAEARDAGGVCCSPLLFALWLRRQVSAVGETEMELEWLYPHRACLLFSHANANAHTRKHANTRSAACFFAPFSCCASAARPQLHALERAYLFGFFALHSFAHVVHPMVFGSWPWLDFVCLCLCLCLCLCVSVQQSSSTHHTPACHALQVSDCRFCRCCRRPCIVHSVLCVRLFFSTRPFSPALNVQVHTQTRTSSSSSSSSDGVQRSTSDTSNSATGSWLWLQMCSDGGLHGSIGSWLCSVN